MFKDISSIEVLQLLLLSLFINSLSDLVLETCKTYAYL